MVALLLLLGLELSLRHFEDQGRLPVPKEWGALLRLRDFDREATRLPEVGVVVLGDSMVGAFDVLALRESLGGGEGREALVASFPGASVSAARFAAEKLILPRLKLRCLVYGITTQAANANGLRRQQEEKVVADLSTILRRSSWRRQWWLYDHLQLYRQQWTLRKWLLKPWRIRLRKPVSERAPLRPWTIRDYPHVFNAERDFDFDEERQEQLRRMVESCKQRGVRFAVMIPPLPDEYGEYWQRGWSSFDSFVERVSALCAILGVPVLNLRSENFAKEEFRDSHHLDREGGSRAATLLGGWILQQGLLD